MVDILKQWPFQQAGMQAGGQARIVMQEILLCKNRVQSQREAARLQQHCCIDTKGATTKG